MSAMDCTQLTLYQNSCFFKAIDNGCFQQCEPWLLEHNHATQYVDVWQFFVGIDSVDIFADCFGTVFSIEQSYNTLIHKLSHEVVFGGKKIRSKAINAGTRECAG